MCISIKQSIIRISILMENMIESNENLNTLQTKSISTNKERITLAHLTISESIFLAKDLAPFWMGIVRYLFYVIPDFYNFLPFGNTEFECSMSMIKTLIERKLPLYQLATILNK